MESCLSEAVYVDGTVPTSTLSLVKVVFMGTPRRADNGPVTGSTYVTLEPNLRFGGGHDGEIDWTIFPTRVLSRISVIVHTKTITDCGKTAAVIILTKSRRS